VRIVCRVPDLLVDPVDDALQPVHPLAQDALQPHPEGRHQNFARIGRADDRDVVGSHQSALQVADVAEIFHAVETVGMGRQSDRTQHLRRELTLEGEVVDRQHDRHRAAHRPHVDRGQCRLPVVAMHEIRLPTGKGAGGDFGRGKRQDGKALPVVGVVVAVTIDIGSAVAVVKLWRIENEQAEAVDFEMSQCGPFAQQIVEFHQRRMTPGLIEQGRITGHEAMRIDAECRQGLGQGACHIGQPAGLDQRIDLGGYGENLQPFARGSGGRHAGRQRRGACFPGDPEERRVGQ